MYHSSPAVSLLHPLDGSSYHDSPILHHVQSGGPRAFIVSQMLHAALYL